MSSTRLLSLPQSRGGYLEFDESPLSPYIRDYKYSMEEEQECGWCAEMLRTSRIGRVIETMQIKWWRMRTGFVVDEGMVSENDFRRDERLVALSEGRPYCYDAT